MWGTYEALNYGVVLPSIWKADPSRPLWPSSPSNGFEGGGVGASGPPFRPYDRNSDASSDARGDVHHYVYGGDCTDTTHLPRPRFIDEFGFPSYPSLSSLRPHATRAPRDLRALTWLPCTDAPPTLF